MGITQRQREQNKRFNQGSLVACAGVLAMVIAFPIWFQGWYVSLSAFVQSAVLIGAVLNQKRQALLRPVPVAAAIMTGALVIRWLGLGWGLAPAILVLASTVWTIRLLAFDSS
jgi:uncharacterized membrane protein YjjP (DUF1212 family)